MSSNPERHVLTGQTLPPSHLHIRLLYKLHCITQLTPELPSTCTVKKGSENTLVLFVPLVFCCICLCGAEWALLWVSCPECWCHWEKITGYHQQQLLTWIHCKDKQTNNAHFVCWHWIFYCYFKKMFSQNWQQTNWAAKIIIKFCKLSVLSR